MSNQLSDFAFDPNPAAPEQPIPDWMYQYLRRDVGATADSSHRHWRDVLEHDASAALWNEIVHQFKNARTGWKLDWLVAHFRHRIIAVCAVHGTGNDRRYLMYKLWLHFLSRRDVK
jgi:hypothetical protein